MFQNSLLDSFQLIVGLYLLYVAIKGNGQMYRFENVPQDRQPAVRRKLRIFYAAAAAVSLADFGVSYLMNTMFTVSAEDSERVITQNYTIKQFPFLTYDLLFTVSNVLSILLIAMLIFALIRLSRSGKRN